jgi:hypothetical protein
MIKFGVLDKCIFGQEDAKYSEVDLKKTLNKPLPYSDSTATQRIIELTVTNGRGYLSLQEALDSVNNSAPFLDMTDVYSKGAIPINFNEGFHGAFLQHSLGQVSGNPCREFLIGEMEPCMLPPPTREPTLLEKLQTIRFIKHDNACRERGVLS